MLRHERSFALPPVATGSSRSAFSTPVTAELLSVGTELLLGEIVDTNSAYLARDLARRGVDVYWSQRVGDNHKRLVEAIGAALARSELLVVSGGLGPTDDDLTREAIAEVVGETPQVDPALEAELRERFSRFGRAMPAKNLKQAWLIPSAEALPNAHGTAPGWLVRTRWQGAKRLIVALPGPPRELEPMWQNEALPRLALPGAALFVRTFKTYGLGESAVAEKLGGLTLQANPSVATYAKVDGVHVRIAAKAQTRAEAEALAAPVLARVEAALAQHLWGADDDTLPALILAALSSSRRTVATMESVTGGMVAELLTSLPGSSRVFMGGVVAYSVEAKVAFGVPGALLDEYGTVSAETVKAMAEAAAASVGATIGLATTGVAGPEPLEGKPVGEAHVALFEASNGARAYTLSLPAWPREWLRERIGYAALAALLRHLRRQSG
jgi:nicotinamide-nucleotide amidase